METRTEGCGRPAKGSHVNDSTLPCGTRVTFGTYKDTKTTRVLLCPLCKAKEGQ